MAQGSVIPTDAISGPVAGRSLWADARARLMRNRAAVAGLAWLALMALLCTIGPEVTGHRYDRIYTEYTRIPPSLTAYPKPDQLASGAERIGSRLRAKPEQIQITT